MDYKYIEQLLDRYFDCMTTLEEEQILRSFFNQEDVPAHLMQYRDIFAYQTENKLEQVSDDFDARILALVEGESKPAVIIPMRSRFAPFFRAAAIVAIILTIGGAAEHSMRDPETIRQENATINPYIKQADVASTLKVTDTYQAETKPQTDSIPAPMPAEKDHSNN